MGPPIKPEGSPEGTPIQELGPNEWAETFYTPAESTSARVPLPDRPTIGGTEEPKRGLVYKLLHGVPGKSRPKELGRSVVRGLAEFGNQAARFGAETVALAADKVGVGGSEEEQDARRERAKDFRINPKEELDAAYGARSDDPLASFAEGATQALASVALLRGVGITNIWAAGAVTDMVAFDPYEASLSEIAAKYGKRLPVGGGAVAKLGELGSVDPNDGFVVASVKRAVEGAVAGAVVEGVLWGARKVRLLKRAAETTSQAEKEAIEKEIVVADEKLHQISQGTQPADPAELVTVRPTEDGQWRHEVNPEHPLAKLNEEQTLREPVVVREGRVPESTHAFIDEFREPFKGNFEGSSNTFLKDKQGRQVLEMEIVPKGGNVVELKVIRSLLKKKSPYPTEQMKRLVELADKHDIVLTLQASPLPRKGTDVLMDPSQLRDWYRQFGFEQTSLRWDANMVRRPGDAPVSFREIAKEAEAAPAQGLSSDLVWLHRGEAEAAAASTNRLARELDDAASPHLFTPEEAAVNREAVSKVVQATSDVEARAVLEGTEVNFHYAAGAEKVRAQVDEIAKMLDDALAEAGEISHEVMIEAARKLAKEVGFEEFAASFKGTTEQMRRQAPQLLAANVAAEQLGSTLARMGEQIAARPHDAALRESARKHLETWLDITGDVLGANSAAGRNLNVIQAAGEAASERIVFKSQALVDATADIQAAKQEITRLGGEATAETAEAITKKITQKASKAGVELPPIADPLKDLNKWIDQAEAAVDRLAKTAAAKEEARTVSRLKRQGKAFEGEQGLKQTPVDKLKIDAKAAERRAREIERNRPKGGIAVVASMSDEEVDAMLRMFQRSGGKVRNAHAVIDGMKVLTNPNRGRIGKAIDFAGMVFINSLISGARTMETIFASGAMLNAFEATIRLTAGAATMNRELAREGADIWMGYFKYAGDALVSAQSAFREGRSIIKPSPQLYARGGVTQDIITIPGRLAGSLDEFTRVSSYRAYERAKSLRQGRREGLEGAELAARVDQDLRASISPEGIGLNEDALKFSGLPTLSDPLGAGLAGDITGVIAKYPMLRFVAPFVRPGVHIFRYVRDATPGINLFSETMRGKLLGKEGAEEAAIALTRTSIAGAAYLYAWSASGAGGNITGRGPTDPTLRKIWLKSHQPYSIRVGGKWRSYRRAEPLGTFLGLAADARMIIGEFIDKEGDETPLEIGGTLVSALVANLANKTYLQSLNDFMSAMASQDGTGLEKWVMGIGTSFVPPQALKQFDADPYYREARTFLDKLMDGTPGLSDRLPPKYDYTGEPVMKEGNLWNRNFSLSPSKTAAPDPLGDELLAHSIRLSPPPMQQFRGAIDYSDPRWVKPGQKLPYVRWMEIVSGGDNPLRKQLEAKIKDESYTRLSGGTSTYPGGARGTVLAAIAGAAYDKAEQQMLREYPELQEAWRGATRLAGAARGYGQEGVDRVREQYGIPKP